MADKTCFVHTESSPHPGISSCVAHRLQCFQVSPEPDLSGLAAATVPPCPPHSGGNRAGVAGERNAAAAGFVWARREVVVCWKPRVEKGFVRTVAQQQAAGITGRSPPALAAHAAQHPAPLAPSPVFVCVFLSFQRPSDPAKSPTPHPPTLTVERTASTSPTATSSLFVAANRSQPHDKSPPTLHRSSIPSTDRPDPKADHRHPRHSPAQCVEINRTHEAVHRLVSDASRADVSPMPLPQPSAAARACD